MPQAPESFRLPAFPMMGPCSVIEAHDQLAHRWRIDHSGRHPERSLPSSHMTKKAGATAARLPSGISRADSGFVGTRWTTCLQKIRTGQRTTKSALACGIWWRSSGLYVTEEHIKIFRPLEGWVPPSAKSGRIRTQACGPGWLRVRRRVSAHNRLREGLPRLATVKKGYFCGALGAPMPTQRPVCPRFDPRGVGICPRFGLEPPRAPPGHRGQRGQARLKSPTLWRDIKRRAANYK